MNKTREMFYNIICIGKSTAIFSLTAKIKSIEINILSRNKKVEK